MTTTTNSTGAARVTIAASDSGQWGEADAAESSALDEILLDMLREAFPAYEFTLGDRALRTVDCDDESIGDRIAAWIHEHTGDVIARAVETGAIAGNGR